MLQARAAFNAKGFVAINGKTLQGKAGGEISSFAHAAEQSRQALYAKAKTILSQSSSEFGSLHS